MHVIQVRAIEAALTLLQDKASPLAVTKRGGHKSSLLELLPGENSSESVSTQKEAELKYGGKMVRNPGYTCNRSFIFFAFDSFMSQ